jgi:hypothetical protein
VTLVNNLKIYEAPHQLEVDLAEAGTPTTTITSM